MRNLRSTVLALLALCVLAPAASAAPVGDASAFEGQGMWIYVLAESNGGDLDSIAADAQRRGVTTIFMKAGDGTRYWPQFSRGLVDALHAHGLRVCGYSRIFSRRPKTEARVSARAVRRTGADCFVIDAEAEYEGRYRQARQYVAELRRHIGPDYPVGLTSFPYVDYHPRFPYSVFLGPSGAQFNLPQIYWRAIGDSVDEAVPRTYAWNSVYGRPIRPLGQVWMNPPASQVVRFRELVQAYGSTGLSWWSWQAAGGRALRGLTRPLPLVSDVLPMAAPPPVLRRGARGDTVRWAQRWLRVRATGYFGSGTARAIRRLQALEGIAVTGVLDAPTWAQLGARAASRF
jgi:hypothetical protein